MKVRPMFAWYDLWVGVFVDRPKRRIYVFPLPCLGLRIDFLNASAPHPKARPRP